MVPRKKVPAKEIDTDKIPAHVAVIMDGNGRWARQRGLPRLAGHKAGVNAVKRTIEASHDLGIKYLTLYAFSVENWSRPADEIAGLMQLLKETLRAEFNDLQRHKIRLKVIGLWRDMAPELVAEIDEVVKATEKNEAGVLCLALNYGGRQEIVDAARQLAREVASGDIRPEDIDTAAFEEHLYTAGIPAPDLLIRTSGEFRISNFLLWQTAYTEFWVTQDLWPDFGREQLEAAIMDFQNRKRRYGGLDKEEKGC